MIDYHSLRQRIGRHTPQERVIGSQAFGAFARTVLVAAKQEDSEGRVLARAKSNISIDDGGVTYFIEPCSLDSGIQTTRVAWGEKVEGSARDILGAVEAPQPASRETALAYLARLRKTLNMPEHAGELATQVVQAKGWRPRPA